MPASTCRRASESWDNSKFQPPDAQEPGAKRIQDESLGLGFMDINRYNGESNGTANGK